MRPRTPRRPRRPSAIGRLLAAVDDQLLLCGCAADVACSDCGDDTTAHAAA